MRLANTVIAVSLVVFFTGCASSVKRDSIVSAPIAAIERIFDTKVTMTAEAQTKLADNIKFSIADLTSTVNRTLEANKQFDKDAAHALEVSVTSFRVRGTFSAVMFGVLAGTDSLDGNVVVKDKAGKLLRKFDVSATYALGGWGGGQDSTRLNWMYEAFAKKISEELAKNS